MYLIMKWIAACYSGAGHTVLFLSEILFKLE